MIFITAAVVSLLLCLSTSDDFVRLFHMWCSGVFIGALLRDSGYLRRMKRNWPFSVKVTDWDKVRAIAESEVPGGAS